MICVPIKVRFSKLCQSLIAYRVMSGSGHSSVRKRIPVWGCRAAGEAAAVFSLNTKLPAGFGRRAFWGSAASTILGISGALWLALVWLAGWV